MESQSFSDLIPQTGPEIKQYFERVIQSMFDRNTLIKREYLNTHNWIAMPVESAGHFSREDIKLILEAIEKAEIQKLFAVALEPLENFPLLFEVPITFEGLEEFSWECGHFNFALIPQDESFSIVCTVYDYYIVAGNQKFVEMAVGGDLFSANEDFLEFAETDQSDQSRLLGVLDFYQSQERVSGSENESKNQRQLS